MPSEPGPIARRWEALAAPLRFLIVFNNSTRESNDDIGVSVSLGGTPNEVLAATFGVPKADFKPIPKLHKEVIITRKR